MTNIVIGIISYLPNDEDIRINRISKLTKLLNKCNKLFPQQNIIIIAQNWGDFQLKPDSKNWVINYDKPLGIVGARKALRRAFLEYTTSDYLIMLDDDCDIRGESGEIYINQINSNPDCFIEFNKTLLKLFAISRKIFREVEFEEVMPENGEGFEDRIFVNKLRKLFPNNRREFMDTGLIECSISTKDPYSTWYKDQNISEMLANTQLKIKNL